MKMSLAALALAVAALPASASSPAAPADTVFKPAVTYVDLLVKPKDAEKGKVTIQEPASLKKLRSFATQNGQDNLGWGDTPAPAPVKPGKGAGPATAEVQKLIEKIQKEGQVGRDPNTGATLKGLKPVAEQIPNGAAVRSAILKGTVDDGGKFTHDAIMAVEVRQTASATQVSPDTQKVEEKQVQSMVVADAAGKAVGAVSVSMTHTDEIKYQERTADAVLKAEYAAELAAVQKALGVSTVEELKARISKDGVPSDDDENPAVVMGIPVQGAAGKEVLLVAAIHGEYQGQTFTPKGLTVVRTEETVEATGDETTQRSTQTAKSYKAGLDGALQEGAVMTKKHELAMAKEESEGADAQAAFDAIVKKLVP